MNAHRDKIKRPVRSRVSVRITTRTRSAAGFVVLVNGEQVHACPTHREAVNNLLVRLQTAPRLKLEVRPA